MTHHPNDRCFPLSTAMAVCFLCFLFFVGPVKGETWQLDLPGENASVEFHAEGSPSALHIKGELEDPQQAISGSFQIKDFKLTGKAQVLLDGFKTGIGLRDRHLKEKYWKTKDHPRATLEITALQIPRAFGTDSFEAEEAFQGTFTLHGQTTPVEGRVKMKGEGKILTMKFNFSTMVTAHKIEVPSFMGVTVADKVRVEAATTLRAMKEME